MVLFSYPTAKETIKPSIKTDLNLLLHRCFRKCTLPAESKQLRGGFHLPTFTPECQVRGQLIPMGIFTPFIPSGIPTPPPLLLPLALLPPPSHLSSPCLPDILKRLISNCWQLEARGNLCFWVVSSSGSEASTAGAVLLEVMMDQQPVLIPSSLLWNGEVTPPSLLGFWVFP